MKLNVNIKKKRCDKLNPIFTGHYGCRYGYGSECNLCTFSAIYTHISAYHIINANIYQHY